MIILDICSTTNQNTVRIICDFVFHFSIFYKCKKKEREKKEEEEEEEEEKKN